MLFVNIFMLDVPTYLVYLSPLTTTKVGACIMLYFLDNSGLSSASISVYLLSFKYSLANPQLGQVFVVNKYNLISSDKFSFASFLSSFSLLALLINTTLDLSIFDFVKSYSCLSLYS